MKTTPDKCHLLISSTSQCELKIGHVTIKSSICEKLLEITIDNKLRLNSHVEDLWKKTSRKIHALTRVRGGSSAAATSKMEFFVIIVNGF